MTHDKKQLLQHVYGLHFFNTSVEQCVAVFLLLVATHTCSELAA